MLIISLLTHVASKGCSCLLLLALFACVIMVPIVRQPKGCIVFVRPTFNAMSQRLVSGSRRACLTCEQREVEPHVPIGASVATLAWWELVILAIVFSIYHFIVHYGVH